MRIAQGYSEGLVSRTEAIEHYRRAIALRPDAPENIKLDIEIALLYDQRREHLDDFHAKTLDPSRGRKPELAEQQFRHILETYSQDDYYTFELPPDGLNSQTVLLPKVALRVRRHKAS